MPIRPATPADVPAILPMVAQICDMHETLDPARYAMLPDVVDRYRRWLPLRATDPDSVFLVADPDLSSPSSRMPDADSRTPSPIGFLIATIESSIPIYRLDRFGFIHDLWVDPAHRRRGLARALILEALDRFRAKGITQVRLETAAANDAARRLFASCGFRAATIDMLAELT